MLRRLKRRYVAARNVLPQIALRPASAMREALAAGYTRADLRADVLAGLVVGVVALPLSMALAIASGVAPQHGIYTAIIAGAVIALLGGSRTQISGPTAAFVVVLSPIATRFGVGGLLLATIMAGVILVVLGIARMGRLIQYIPYPVTAGFTAGIAVVIATLQLKDALGLTVAHMPEHYLERVTALLGAAPTARAGSVAIAAVTLVVLLGWPRIDKRLPAPLVALVVAGVAAWVLGKLAPAHAVETIASRFSYELSGVRHAGIPQLPPLPILPWQLAGPDGQPMSLTVDVIRQLAPSAFAIAMLGAIESLLSAVVADGMAGTKHDPDAELVAQGIGNMVAPFFGGIAATGAIARTATNVRAGGRSPIAAVVHAAFLLLATLLLAPLVGYLPMPALGALLVVVAWNMSDAKHCIHVLRVAPKSDVVVLLACLSLTVLFDMVVAVSAGVMLAALLFMRRMAEITGVTLSEGEHPALRERLPPGVVLYQIAGPLFFGAAQKAMSAMEKVAGGVSVVILDISSVPVMDATGLVNLESALDRLRERRALVVLVGAQAQPAGVLRRAGIDVAPGRIAMCATLGDATEVARKHVGQEPAPSGGAA